MVGAIATEQSEALQPKVWLLLVHRGLANAPYHALCPSLPTPHPPTQSVGCNRLSNPCNSKTPSNRIGASGMKQGSNIFDGHWGLPFDKKWISKGLTTGATLCDSSLLYNFVLWQLTAHKEAIDPSHKFHNALDKYPTVHHFVTKLCRMVHFGAWD